jgi:hypothetical protein
MKDTGVSGVGAAPEREGDNVIPNNMARFVSLFYEIQ